MGLCRNWVDDSVMVLLGNALGIFFSKLDPLDRDPKIGLNESTS